MSQIQAWASQGSDLGKTHTESGPTVMLAQSSWKRHLVCLGAVKEVFQEEAESEQKPLRWLGSPGEEEKKEASGGEHSCVKGVRGVVRVGSPGRWFTHSATMGPSRADNFLIRRMRP